MLLKKKLLKKEGEQFELRVIKAGIIETLPCEYFSHIFCKFFQVFSPKESVSSPLVLHLIFCQIVQDVLVRPIARISSEERMDMVQLLDQYGVTPSNMYSNQHKANTKRAVLDLARHWATYFARIFYISGGYQLPEVIIIKKFLLSLNHFHVAENKLSDFLSGALFGN